MHGSLPPDWSWIAYLDGTPAAAFGFQPYTYAVWIGWAFGTRAMVRAIPAITRHCWAQEQRLLDIGARRVEVRSLKGHDIAQAWLTRLGCKWRCDLPDSGRDGETFELWSWQLGDGRPTRNTQYRMRKHVFSQSPESAPASAPA